MEDPAGRKHIADLVPFAKARRLVPVGRLERNATGERLRRLKRAVRGIMFLTNDYEWHTVLVGSSSLERSGSEAHPRYEMTRRYRVRSFVQEKNEKNAPKAPKAPKREMKDDI